jgi:hypothetical protein
VVVEPGDRGGVVQSERPYDLHHDGEATRQTVAVLGPSRVGQVGGRLAR